MKYVLINDLNYLFKNKYKLFLFIFTLCLYPIYIRIILNYRFDSKEIFNIFLSNIGISGFINSIIEFGMLLFNTSFICYIISGIYNINSELGNENIFLRISYKKWILYKLLSIIIINIIILMSELSVLFIIYKFLFSTNFNYFELIINILESKLILSLLILIVYNISDKIYFVIINLLYLIFAINKSKFGILLYYDSIYYKIILLVLCIIIFVYISKKNIYNQVD